MMMGLRLNWDATLARVRDSVLPRALQSNKLEAQPVGAIHDRSISKVYPKYPRIHIVLEYPPGPAFSLTRDGQLTQELYDLLPLIPTQSPSRILWGADADPPDVIAGPRYEDLP